MLTFSLLENTSNHSKIYGSWIIDRLGLTTDDYLVFASGAMVAHGLMDKNEDIDLYIRPRKFKELIKKGLLVKHEKPEGGITYYSDKSGVCDCYDTLTNINGKSEKWWFERTEIIDGIRVQSIDSLKNFYKALYKKRGKEKHKKRLDMLEKL